MKGLSLHDFARDVAEVIRHDGRRAHGHCRPRVRKLGCAMTAVDHPQLVRGVVS